MTSRSSTTSDAAEGGASSVPSRSPVSAWPEERTLVGHLRTFAIAACLLACLPVLRPATATAQTVQRAPSQPDSILRQWELRGVAIAGAVRLAVLAHRPSGRQRIVRMGDALGDGLSLSTITEDRVVLDSAGNAVTLRLGHGGRGHGARLIPVRPRPPRTILDRWRGRR